MKRLAPVAAVLVLAGCGGPAAKPPAAPQLPRALAGAWRSKADAVASALAAGDGCLARRRALALQSSVIAHVRRVPGRFQEPLVSAVNDLAARISCAPPAPAPAPAPRPAPQPHPPHPPHPPHGHEHGHGHGPHG